ncbi:hypothetical protein LTR78_006698 [Recurvomyces mirabilis]|uniref:Uncharacterized protein n=1 Tax=Recurvomyces mirabilis TaxID=574656 RepID=A0AAE1BZV0_9PEZI|nr:hypothetical protein LTR78_006698 [Recurvomyces mirabilis]KAK5151412.1 hypothetical protein LTS14_009255 [Recurvomyces mirabilis]
MADLSTVTGFDPPQEPQAQIQVFTPTSIAVANIQYSRPSPVKVARRFTTPFMLWSISAIADIGAILTEMGQQAANVVRYSRPYSIPPSDPVLPLQFGLFKDWDTQLFDLSLRTFQLGKRILDGNVAFHHLLKICATCRRNPPDAFFPTSMSRVYLNAFIQMCALPAQGRKSSSVTQSPLTNTKMLTLMRTSVSGVSSLSCALGAALSAVGKASSVAER